MKKIYEFVYPNILNQSIFDIQNSQLLPEVGEYINVFLNGTTKLEAIIIDIDGVSKIELTSSINMKDYLLVEMISDLIYTVGDRDNAVFKRYGAASEPRLVYNQDYIGSINIVDVENINIKFTSRLTPFYCTTKSVKNDVEHIVNISDAAINYLIYDYSKQVLVELSGNGDVTYDLPAPLELTDPSKIPYNIQQYVRYSVEYDIINTAYIMIANKAGSKSKRLAELTVEESVKLPDLDDYLRAIRDKLAKFKLTGSSIFATFVKGSATEPYPLIDPRRTF